MSHIPTLIPKFKTFDRFSYSNIRFLNINYVVVQAEDACVNSAEAQFHTIKQPQCDFIMKNRPQCAAYFSHTNMSTNLHGKRMKQEEKYHKLFSMALSTQPDTHTPT